MDFRLQRYCEIDLPIRVDYRRVGQGKSEPDDKLAKELAREKLASLYQRLGLTVFYKSLDPTGEGFLSAIVLDRPDELEMDIIYEPHGVMLDHIAVSPGKAAGGPVGGLDEKVEIGWSGTGLIITDPVEKVVYHLPGEHW